MTRHGFPLLCLTALLAGCGSGDAADIARLQAGQPLTEESAAGHAVVHVDVEGGAVMEGKNAFAIWFEPASTELTGASALMPVHGHGFARAPVIEKTEDGYRVRDVVFYMSGLWNVHLDLNVDDHTDHLEFSVDVP
jgi:hypothetical protein